MDTEKTRALTDGLAFNPLNAKDLIKAFGLFGVWAIMFAETGLMVGFFLPGDSLLFVAGVFASSFLKEEGIQLNIWGLLIGGPVFAILGAQVGHWMSVVEGWKNRLGSEWESTYAVNNTMYVTRQNNILYSILVQFMGTETMGERLLLVETAEFETTPEKMLDVLARIVADRSLGMVFFRDFFAMDVELLGGGGRAAIQREMANRGLEAVLPSLAPFRSNDWPWKTDPTKGRGPARLEDAVPSCPVL